MACSSSSRKLEERFDALCTAHNELLARFYKLEKKQVELMENEHDNTNTIYKLAKKLYDYGYLTPPDKDMPKPLPEISSAGCRIIRFRKEK